jgi:DUF971 family protein
MKPVPTEIQLIENEVALKWSDGRENFIPSEDLRAASPSAENQGESDLFGNRYGGTSQTSFPGVKVVDWERIGNYAVRFVFSDGHQTGLFTYPLLRSLGNG